MRVDRNNLLMTKSSFKEIINKICIAIHLMLLLVIVHFFFSSFLIEIAQYSEITLEFLLKLIWVFVGD